MAHDRRPCERGRSVEFGGHFVVGTFVLLDAVLTDPGEQGGTQGASAAQNVPSGYR